MFADTLVFFINQCERKQRRKANATSAALITVA